MAERVFYSILAPKRRAPFRDDRPGWPDRRLLRWLVVRETVSRRPGSTITAFGFETISAHWTWRAADRARREATDG